MRIPDYLLLRISLIALSLKSLASKTISQSFFLEPDSNPGFITRIDQKALDFLADYIRQQVNKFMNHGDFSFNLSRRFTNEVHFRIMTSRKINYNPEMFKSEINLVANRGIVWTGSHFTSSIETVFILSFMENDYYGNAILIIETAIIELMFTAGINSDGHLRNELEYCRVPNARVYLNYSAADATVLSNYLALINHFIREKIDDVLCSNLIEEILPTVTNRLLNTPLSAALFDQYFINYGLLEAVQYLPNSIILKHRGNTFGVLRQGRNRFNDYRLPFRSPKLLIPQSNNKMVDFYLSNYTISSLFFWMDQYRKFDYEVSKESMNSSALTGYLRTECGNTEICAGTIFPELSTQFPGGIVQIKTYTTTYPRVILNNGKVLVSIWSRIDAFVQQWNETRRFLTSGMFAEVAFRKPTFSKYVFNSEMAISRFKVFDVVSLVNGIDAGSLEFLVGALNELIIGEDVAKKLQDGITLPIVFDFNQKSAEISFEENRIRISIDFCVETDCSRSPTNNQTEDYYDSV